MKDGIGATSFTIHMDYIEVERYIEVCDAIPWPFYKIPLSLH